MAVIRRNFFQKIRNRFGRRKAKKENYEIKNLLRQVYPGESIERRYREYRLKKYGVAVVIIFFGTGAFVCMQVGSRMYDRLEEGTHLTRNEWGEGSYDVTLQAKTESEDVEIDYTVKERILTKEEQEVLLESLCERLPYVILGENDNLSQVRSNLVLVSGISGYPFQITWKSDDFERVAADGKVNSEDVDAQGEKVLLTAIISYEGEVYEYSMEITVLPRILSAKEQFEKKLLSEIAGWDAYYAQEKQLVLPSVIGGETLSWEEKKGEGSIGILFLGVVGAFLSSAAAEAELQKKSRERREEIIRSYPEFISRLKLYMGAGLTIRNAFLRIGKDYREEKRRTGRKEYLYEELLISGYQLINGKGEENVYREWGRRCEVMCCRKLSFLLASSLRQGNNRILVLLEKEAGDVWEESRNAARKQGEEAGTKLLFPMLMMLLLVMLLILIPAFSGM